MAKEVKNTENTEQVQKTEEQKGVEANFEQVTVHTPEEVAKNVKEANFDYVNIDNPDHGNLTYAQLQDNAKRTSEHDEAVPTSESSKELSRKLADMTKEERREFVNGTK